MRSYSYNTKLNILETKAGGNLEINDIIGHYKWISENNSLPKNLKVLIDCRNAKFYIDTEEVNLTYDALKNAVYKYDSITEAIIVDKPYETVIATLYKEHLEIMNYSFKIFSTESAAYTWLNFE